MRIAQVQAFPISFPYPPDGQVALGIGRTVKRDAVLVKVTTDDGLVGWGESHAGRAPGAIARLVETTLKHLVLGMDATDVSGVGARIYRMQLASHGMGAAAAIAMSGLDMALWDIRGKAVGWPLYRLLGGAARAIPAYAGGISLGFQEPEALVEEAVKMVAHGYRALKLRLGDTPARDIARVAAVRRGLGSDITLLTDANTAYGLAEARAVMPALDANAVAWLEEPFPAHDHRSYAEARRFGSVPLAAGENHYTRYEFTRLIEDRVVTILQPDLSKCGGITEGLRIAAMASAWKLPVNPHTSVTGLNMAASIHFLAAVENGGYFEADASKLNPFRDRLCSSAFTLEVDGTVRPSEAAGLGVEIDEGFLAAHPVIDGPGYV
ncbi:MAG: mandelate racemase/muconate lactonizing enzyme family protein [Alphaproteobacteria bacterium]